MTDPLEAGPTTSRPRHATIPAVGVLGELGTETDAFGASAPSDDDDGLIVRWDERSMGLQGKRASLRASSGVSCPSEPISPPGRSTDA